MHGVINAKSRRDDDHMGPFCMCRAPFYPFLSQTSFGVVIRAWKEQKFLLVGCDLPGRRHRAAFPPYGSQLEPCHAKPSSSFPAETPQKPILRMQARLARTPRVRMVELVFTLLAPLMLHKEVSQQLVATPAMPMFRSIVGQNAEHFLVIRWFRLLPGVGGRENNRKSPVFHLGFFFFFFAGFSHSLAVQSHGEFVILHLMPLGFPLGFITFHHYMCMCDLWTPPPGLTNPLLVSGSDEGKNMGLICTM